MKRQLGVMIPTVQLTQKAKNEDDEMVKIRIELKLKHNPAMNNKTEIKCRTQQEIKHQIEEAEEMIKTPRIERNRSDSHQHQHPKHR